MRCLFLFSVSFLLLLCVVNVTAHDDGGSAATSAVTMLATERRTSEKEVAEKAKAATEIVLGQYYNFLWSVNAFLDPLDFLLTKLRNLSEKAESERIESKQKAMMAIRKIGEKINAEKKKLEELKKSEYSTQNKFQSIHETINNVSQNIAEVTAATTSRKINASIDHGNTWEKVHNLTKLVEKASNISKGLLNETTAQVSTTEGLEQVIAAARHEIMLATRKLKYLKAVEIHKPLDEHVKVILEKLQLIAKDMCTSSTDGQKYAKEATQKYDELLKRVENMLREIEEGNSNIYSTRNVTGKKQRNNMEYTATTLTGEELMFNAQNNTQQRREHLKDNGTNESDVRTNGEHQLQTEKGENAAQLGLNNTSKITKANLNQLLAAYMSDSSHVVVANIVLCFALYSFVVLFNNF